MASRRIRAEIKAVLLKIKGWSPGLAFFIQLVVI
jgi:hypothetical protein